MMLVLFQGYIRTFSILNDCNFALMSNNAESNWTIRSPHLLRLALDLRNGGSLSPNHSSHAGRGNVASEGD